MLYVWHMKTKTPIYVLEKIWKFKPGIKLAQDNIYEILIRPCNVSYNVYRRFSLGLPTRTRIVTHEGCVMAWWSPSSDMHSCSNNKSKTFEEFMVIANIKNIFPDMENWLINYEWNSYFVKTIDLKKNEVLYDNQDTILAKLNEQCKTI